MNNPFCSSARTLLQPNMGLELICGKQSVHMPYSYIQKIRRHWITAYCNWAQDHGYPADVPNREKLMECLNSENIDYDAFSEIKADCGVYQGLKRFVDHSDCDGEWSEYDSAFILTTLLQLNPYLAKIAPQDFDENGKYFLKEILHHSVLERSSIFFV